MNTAKRIAVVLLTYDGIMSWYCGVGSITQYFVHSIPEVARKQQEEGHQMSFYVAIPSTQPGCLGYRADLLKDSRRILRATGGDLLQFCDNSDGVSQFGSLENWKAASTGAASIVVNMMSQYDEIIVIGFDTPYCGVGSIISKQLSHHQGRKPIVVWVPHSTGLVHEVRGVSHSSQRYEWERSAIESAREFDNCYVGYINKFMQDHLIDAFDASRQKLVPLINGVASLPLKPCKKPTWLAGKPTVFATGRAERYKGFEHLIRAFAASQETHNAQLVILASTNTAFAPVFDELSQLMKTLHVRGKLINDFVTMDVLSEIFNSQEVKAVVVPSEGEPFGLIPEEVRLLAKFPSPTLIVSKIHGLDEQVNSGIDGFSIDTHNAVDFGKCISKVVNMSQGERDCLSHAGRAHLKREYIYANNITKLLDMLLAQNLSEPPKAIISSSRMAP